MSKVDVIANGSFENGWTDMPPIGSLINQKPDSWSLAIQDVNEFLWDSHDVVHGIPECVHKHATQLPADEQRGAINALILDGEYVYKVFHANASFGARLTQVIDGGMPGTIAELTVPVILDLHGDPDPWAVEVGVFLNGALGDWHNAGELGHRRWNYIKHTAPVPSDGLIEVDIFMKSKWDRPKDVFLDAISLLAEYDGGTQLPTRMEVSVPANIVEVVLRIQR